MPTQPYFLKDGTRVPGVTTVISTSLGWNKGALMHWAWVEGKEGRDYKKSTDDAAKSGTIAHALIEAHLRGLPYTTGELDKEVLQKARTAYDAYLEFEKSVELKVIGTETPLVSETHKYGGTIDIVSTKNRVSIIDVKTSKAVYPDHLVQVAAYGRLWNENHPDTPISGYYIIQLGKDDGGSFTFHFYPQLDDAWEVFKHLLGLYGLKKRMGG